ncbi:MbtH family protein [Lysobacter enzymogenes]|uniref:MbtH family protein n=1 Tax=Lysobacter enzymogenes TaxID=69 RepID=A0A3N2RFI9_LYSEN|nr:MbtH family protein [Lysobacter enzymogenes]ROU06211.1 MbtH family protein [Lysobacter enzymogenes]
MSEPDSSEDYIVLINDEEQYSLWSQSIPVPPGWRVTHGPAARQACLDYVDEVWKDLTPRSVRLRLQQAADTGRAAE